tara:strand:- start:58 stop:453 length:396 start_codon:yes stop_codon:yes gene_type:complete
MKGGSDPNSVRLKIRLGRCGDTAATPSAQRSNKNKFMCIEREDDPKARVNVNLKQFAKNYNSEDNFKDSLSAAEGKPSSELHELIKAKPNQSFEAANHLLTNARWEVEEMVFAGPIENPFLDDDELDGDSL